MTLSQALLVSAFLYTLLFALMLLLRPWRSIQFRPGTEGLAGGLATFSVAVLFLLCAFFLVISVLTATVWANPSVPDTSVPTSSYLFIAIPLLGLGILGYKQLQARRRLDSGSS